MTACSTGSLSSRSAACHGKPKKHCASSNSGLHGPTPLEACSAVSPASTRPAGSSMVGQSTGGRNSLRRSSKSKWHTAESLAHLLHQKRLRSPRVGRGAQQCQNRHGIDPRCSQRGAARGPRHAVPVSISAGLITSRTTPNARVGRSWTMRMSFPALLHVGQASVRQGLQFQPTS